MKQTGLTPHDFRTEVGVRLVETLHERIKQHQKDLEADALDAIKTAKVRGRIAECRTLLALAEAPVKESGPENIGTGRVKTNRSDTDEER